MSRYAEHGVDVHKKGIEVFEATIKNLFPGAFCVVVQDPRDPRYGLIVHEDSAGSKPVQNYLHWKETGDINCFEGSAQDAVAMNVDDVYCVGARPIAFADYIAINKLRLPKKEVLTSLNSGFGKCLAILEKYGINMPFAGGETADLPDQLRTIDVVGTAVASVRIGDLQPLVFDEDDKLIESPVKGESEVITGYEIDPGNIIIGFRSGGKTKYEDKENSGLMCNGITLGRHCLMKGEYAEKYPEIRDPEGSKYTGRFSVNDYVDDLGMTVSEAIISPTRLFAPVLERLLKDYRPHITGMVHNTGGGQTKCLRLGNNVHYVKHDVLEIDPIFPLIKREGDVEWREMFQDYNMGTGFEVIVDDKDVVDDILSIAERLFGLGGGIIGYVERSDGKNKLTIHTDLSSTGKFHYP